MARLAITPVGSAATEGCVARGELAARHIRALDTRYAALRRGSSTRRTHRRSVRTQCTRVRLDPHAAHAYAPRMYEALGHLIRERREALGLDQAALAAQLDVGQQAI